jgi:hypothetical protein
MVHETFITKTAIIKHMASSSHFWAWQGGKRLVLLLLLAEKASPAFIRGQRPMVEERAFPAQKHGKVDG